LLGRRTSPTCRRDRELVCAAFVEDTFSRRIVGWSAATVKETIFVLDTREMAVWQRDRDQPSVIPAS
jgi:putative transposase